MHRRGISLTALSEDKKIDAHLTVRTYAPVSAKGEVGPLSVGLYFYGGGFCCGDLDSEDTFYRELAERLPCLIVSVDYSLAPEHKVPAQVDDALKAWDWVGVLNPSAPIRQQNVLTLKGIQ